MGGVHGPSDRSSKRPVATGPQPVFLIFGKLGNWQLQSSCNQLRSSPVASLCTSCQLDFETLIVIVVCRPFVLWRPCCHCCHCQPSPTSLLSSSSTGHLSCGGLVLVVIWWGPCRHWGLLSAPTSSSSSSMGHFSCGGLILIVVWWGSCCPSLTLSLSLSSACLVGASSSLPHIIIVVHRPLVLQRPCPSPTLLSSSPGHLSCRGLVAIIVQWGPPPPQSS